MEYLGKKKRSNEAAEQLKWFGKVGESLYWGTKDEENRENGEWSV